MRSRRPRGSRKPRKPRKPRREAQRVAELVRMTSILCAHGHLVLSARVAGERKGPHAKRGGVRWVMECLLAIDSAEARTTSPLRCFATGPVLSPASRRRGRYEHQQLGAWRRRSSSAHTAPIKRPTPNMGNGLDYSPTNRRENRGPMPKDDDAPWALIHRLLLFRTASLRLAHDRAHSYTRMSEPEARWCGRPPTASMCQDEVVGLIKGSRPWR